LFYLLPISLAAWYANPTLGLFISVLSAVPWLVSDITVEEDYSHPIVYFWNTLIRFGFFIIVTCLIAELRKTQQTIQTLARIDYITGVSHPRVLPQ
jgi:hypothetical protein